jgi:uncharacterized protein (DUF2141 family)
MTRLRALASLLFLAVTGSLADSAAADDGASSLDVIEFRTTTRNDKGMVRCGLFTRKGWLEDALRASIVKIKDREALCIFHKVPKGVYGISAYHDENSNKKLDTNFVGMPTEDYCASRNARNTFGPPSFDDAKFEFTGGTKRLTARMK